MLAAIQELGKNLLGAFANFDGGKNGKNGKGKPYEKGSPKGPPKGGPYGTKGGAAPKFFPKGGAPGKGPAGKGSGPPGTMGPPAYGGDPSARGVCKHYLATGSCSFSPWCKFRHIPAAPRGPLHFLGRAAKEAGVEIPSAALPSGAIAPEEEADAAIKAFDSCGICDEDGQACTGEEFRAYLQEHCADFPGVSSF